MAGPGYQSPMRRFSNELLSDKENTPSPLAINRLRSLLKRVDNNTLPNIDTEKSIVSSSLKKAEADKKEVAVKIQGGATIKLCSSCATNNNIEEKLQPKRRRPVAKGEGETTKPKRTTKKKTPESEAVSAPKEKKTRARKVTGEKVPKPRITKKKASGNGNNALVVDGNGHSLSMIEAQTESENSQLIEGGKIDDKITRKPRTVKPKRTTKKTTETEESLTVDSKSEGTDERVKPKKPKYKSKNNQSSITKERVILLNEGITTRSMSHQNLETKIDNIEKNEENEENEEEARESQNINFDSFLSIKNSENQVGNLPIDHSDQITNNHGAVKKYALKEGHNKTKEKKVEKNHVKTTNTKKQTKTDTKHKKLIEPKPTNIKSEPLDDDNISSSSMLDDCKINSTTKYEEYSITDSGKKKLALKEKFLKYQYQVIEPESPNKMSKSEKEKTSECRKTSKNKDQSSHVKTKGTLTKMEEKNTKQSKTVMEKKSRRSEKQFKKQKKLAKAVEEMSKHFANVHIGNIQQLHIGSQLTDYDSDSSSYTSSECSSSCSCRYESSSSPSCKCWQCMLSKTSSDEDSDWTTSSSDYSETETSDTSSLESKSSESESESSKDYGQKRKEKHKILKKYDLRTKHDD